MTFAHADQLRDIYAKNDLAEHPYFSGGYINFGFWRGLDIETTLSAETRIKASQSLYEYVWACSKLNESDEVLELSCGHGLGCIMAAHTFQVKSVIGLDLQPEQIERCKRTLAETPYTFSSPKIRFHVGSADNSGLPSQSFSKILTLEAAQHYPSIPQFLSEAYRLLTPGGTLTISTFLPETQKSLERLKNEVPSLDLTLHPMLALDDTLRASLAAGFKLDYFERIGQDVFYGFEQWVLQTGVQETWGHVWLDAYEKSTMDYFVLILRK